MVVDTALVVFERRCSRRERPLRQEGYAGIRPQPSFDEGQKSSDCFYLSNKKIRLAPWVFSQRDAGHYSAAVRNAFPEV